MLPSESDEQRKKIVEKVRQYGSSAADAVLGPSCSFFSIPDVDGFIGYRLEKSCAVVYGDPLCAFEDIPKLVSAFHAHCKKEHLSVIYIIITEEFARWTIQANVCKVMIEFGEELIMDPHHDPRKNTGVYASLVRRKVRHALKEGATVHEYFPSDSAELEQEIEKVGALWLKGRRGLQLHISHVRLFSDRDGKRWLYAKQGDKIVGVIVLNRLDTYRGWLINHLMHLSDAPHGIPELLLVTALETVAKEGAQQVTFGAVPGVKLGEIIGLNKFSTWLSRNLFKLIYRLFRLNGRKKFWEKFDPESRRSFLLFSEKHVRLKEIRALMRALNVAL